MKLWEAVAIAVIGMLALAFIFFMHVLNHAIQAGGMPL